MCHLMTRLRWPKPAVVYSASRWITRNVLLPVISNAKMVGFSDANVQAKKPYDTPEVFLLFYTAVCTRFRVASPTKCYGTWCVGELVNKRGDFRFKSFLIIELGFFIHARFFRIAFSFNKNRPSNGDNTRIRLHDIPYISYKLRFELNSQKFFGFFTADNSRRRNNIWNINHLIIRHELRPHGYIKV